MRASSRVLHPLCLVLFLAFSAWSLTPFLGCDPSPTPGDGGAPKDDAPSERTGPPPAPHAKPTGCHPFSQGKGDCALPFPSSYFTVKDDSTPTKLRVAFPDKGVLPVSVHGPDKSIPMDARPFNARDGFSPATPLLVYFPERVDPATLPDADALANSLKADSPIQLIEFGTHKRVPLFAEVDRSIKGEEPQIVLIRPMVRLKPGTRYAVVMLKAVKAADGKALTVPKAYLRLAAGEDPQTPAEAALAPKVKETLQEAKDAGIDAKDILLSWDFTTGSDAPLLDQMLSMRDQMLAKIGAGSPEFKVENVFNYTPEQKKHVARIVIGKYKVPSFLDKDGPGSRLLLDEKGKPKIRGMGEFVFYLHVPRCALTQDKPVAIMQFGHGLFGGAQGEMDSGYQRSLIDRLCMVQIGHNWIGLASEDRGYVGTSILPDMNNVARLANRLQQAHVNAIALTRLIKFGLLKHEALQHNGKALIDGKQIYYLGISNGAIQGGGFMALSPDVTRGVLNVGGGPWNMMMSRSSNFAALFVAMKVFYTNAIERQLLIALSQVYFDAVDPLTFAPYVLSDPKRLGIPAKKIIIQEAIGDAQVPNIATHVWARTMGVPALKELFSPVYGLELKAGPLDGSAYTQFGPKPDPFPKNENVPPRSNPAHEAARRTEGCMKQMENFFTPDGKIQHYCQGPCDPD